MVHVAEPLVGFVAVSSVPFSPPATHRLVEGHAIVCSMSVPTCRLVHAPGPPVAPAATQNVVVGHEMPVSSPARTAARVHAPAPAVGFVEVTKSPALSTTTHWAADAQSMSTRPPPIEVGDVHWPPAGLLEAIALPPRSMAAQKPFAGHETLSMMNPPVYGGAPSICLRG